MIASCLRLRAANAVYRFGSNSRALARLPKPASTYAALGQSRTFSLSYIRRAEVETQQGLGEKQETSSSVDVGQPAQVESNVEKELETEAKPAQLETVTEEEFPANGVIYIGNLTAAVNKPQLLELFGEFGDIEQAFISVDRKRNRRHAHLQFSSPAGAKAALIQHRSKPLELDGQELWVHPRRAVPGAYPPSTTLFIGSLPWNVTEEEVRSFFSTFGEIAEIKRINKFKNYVHVRFATQEAASAVVQASMEGLLVLRDQSLDIQYANVVPFDRPSSTLYLKGYGSSVNEEELKQKISSIAEFMAIRFKSTELTERGEGFCHIDFVDVETATKVLKAHEEDPIRINGQPIIIEYSPPRNVRRRPRAQSIASNEEQS